MEKFNFEINNDPSLDEKLRKKLNKKLKNLDGLVKHDQIPYLKTSKEKYNLVYQEYRTWIKHIGTCSEEFLFGFTDTFPYPEVRTKSGFVDLAEKNLEDEW